MNNLKHNRPSGAKQDVRVPVYTFSVCCMAQASDSRVRFSQYGYEKKEKKTVYCSMQRGEYGILRLYDIWVCSLVKLHLSCNGEFRGLQIIVFIY